MEKIKEKLTMAQKKPSHIKPWFMRYAVKYPNEIHQKSKLRSFLSKIDEANENNVEVYIPLLDFILACRKMKHLLSGINFNPPSPSFAHDVVAVKVNFYKILFYNLFTSFICQLLYSIYIYI